MLIVKVQINSRIIDTIYIHNTAVVEDGKHVYELIDKESRWNVPKGDFDGRLTNTTILHRRSDGYRKLLIKVLELMEEEGIEPKG